MPTTYTQAGSSEDQAGTIPVRFDDFHGIRGQVLPLEERTGTGFTEAFTGLAPARNIKLYLTITEMGPNENGYVACTVQETVDGENWLNLPAALVEIDDGSGNGRTAEDPPLLTAMAAPFDNKSFADTLRVKYVAEDDNGDLAATFRCDWIVT